MKGLQRSIRRGPVLRQDLINQQIPFSILVTATDGAPGWATAVLTNLPEGYVLYQGGVVDLTITSLDANITDTFEGDIALGMAPTTDGALTGNQANLTLSTAIPAAVAGVGEVTAMGANTQNGTIFNNTDGSLEVNLNIAIDDAAISADADLLLEGVLYLGITMLGDED